VGDDRTNKEQDEADCGRNPEQGHAETDQESKRARRLEGTQ